MTIFPLIKQNMCADTLFVLSEFLTILAMGKSNNFKLGVKTNIK